MARGSRRAVPGTVRLWVVGGLVALASVTGVGAKPVPQSVAGPFWYDGNVVSGGELVYRVRIDTVVPGVVTASAKIKGKDKDSGVKWQGVFPMLHQDLLAGQTDITSAPIPIPGNYVGEARLQIDVRFNDTPIGKGKLTVVVSAPPPPPVVITDTLRDVGLDTVVTLDVEGATKGAVSKDAPHTYLWTQTAGAEVELSDPTAANPTFRTHPIGHFVELGEGGGLVGISTAEVNASTYTFRVQVDGGAKGVTGKMTVIAASMSPAQATVPLGVNAYFKAEVADHASFDWALVSAPAGSTAALMNATTRTPHIRPDLPGTYTVRDTITTDLYAVTGATYVGVATCALCHGPEPVADIFGLTDMVTPWSLTGHATMLDRGLDGLLSSHYNEGCISCHSVGYNLAPTADNHGFDDVAADVGWEFPVPLQAGNSRAMPEALYAMANIQCENCHGPGSSHPGGASESLDAAVCATCHDDGSHHVRPVQWRASAHNQAYKELSEEEGTRTTCNKCHSPAGFLATLEGNTTVTGSGPLTCQVCHDPHNVAGNEYQLRIGDTVPLADGVVLDNLGASGTCVYCHNARRGPTNATANSSYTPHGATKAEVFYGVNGYTFGETIAGPFAHAMVAGCTTCHMAENPAAGDPGHNKVGDHTFAMAYEDEITKEEVDNVGACNRCHGEGEVTDFNYRGDAYDEDNDGDGVKEGIQMEVQGLLDIVSAKLVETGVSADFRTGWSTDATKKALQRGANWNRALVTNDKSMGVHNPQYAIVLLQLSYTKLSQGFGGPSFREAFPLADLR